MDDPLSQREPHEADAGLEAAIEARRSDAEFMDRLKRHHEEEKALYERLAGEHA